MKKLCRFLGFFFCSIPSLVISVCSDGRYDRYMLLVKAGMEVWRGSFGGWCSFPNLGQMMFRHVNDVSECFGQYGQNLCS